MCWGWGWGKVWYSVHSWHGSRYRESGKPGILLTKCQIDKRQISIPKMSVLIVAFLKERKKKKQSGESTRLSYLNCNSDLTITHWCCSSRSNRTWPLLIWQSFCHNSLPTVVIIFEKICIPFLLQKSHPHSRVSFHALLSYGTACHQTSRAAHHSPSLRPFSEHTLKFN